MDLDAAAEELYGGSPDDFVERRTALVAAARKARERELVKQIGALRRPTRTAWLVNLLARESPADVEELLELGDALAEAQRRGSGADLRRLSTDRRKLVDRLARQAVELGSAHGHAAPDAALQEVSQTLQAALGDDATREQLRAGRLTTAVSYGGFGPFTMPEVALEPERKPEEPEDEPREREEEPPFDKLRERKDELREHKAEAEAAWESAQRAEAEAQRDAEEATARADDLAVRIDELRAELTAAEADEREARELARTARQHLKQVRQAATEAEEAVAALEGDG